MSVTSRRSRLAIAIATGTLVGAGLLGANLAFAANVALSGSSFEIDSDANLKVDSAGLKDWANVTEIRKADSPSGGGDESFGNGTKEDTAVPSIVDGGIPPNKSDLKFFGVYQEGTSSSGFLNLFWSRVQDPTGTTNMDFEFNKNKCAPGTAGSVCSANGVTPVRSIGDLLITYDLSNGGTNPSLSLRTWSGSAWGSATNLTASGKATGSINTSAIPSGESDLLGAHSARTFGEAQIKLSEVLGTTCTTFGSAYLKSRSSDSFTAALKDFVPPQVVNVTNCGSIEIVKRGGSLTGSLLDGAVFKIFKDNAPLGGTRGAEDTLAGTCTSGATTTGKCLISNVQFGDYWVVEETPPSGYELDETPEQLVTVSSATPSQSVTFVNQVAIIPSSMTTEQRWLPNHRASITVGNTQGTLAGTVTFRLYENATCSGAPAQTFVRNVVTDDTDGTAGGYASTVLTGNTSFYTSSQAVSWGVEFNSTNVHHADSVNNCDKSSWTLTNNYSG